MNKYIKIFFIYLCLFLNFSYGFEFKSPFKKKQSQEKPKMIETREQWEKEALNIPLEERKLEDKKPEIDTKKFNMPEPKYTFEAYNFPQGSRELDYKDVKNNLFYYSYLVADKNFQYAAYSHYYFAPDSNQISSNFFVEKLDTSKTKTKRILDYKHKQQTRTPIIESGLKNIYQDYFSGLTLVDWSKDSRKILIKEKIGSTRNGVYKTNLYIHFMENEIEPGKTIKLDDFSETIKNYFQDWENKQLIKYRYDIIPLGFSEENDDIIIAICYVYNNESDKIFLGIWGYNCKKRETILLSKENKIPQISVNGLFLKQTLE